MEAIKKMECIVVDDRQYQVEGFGQDLRDGSFQSVCQIVTTQGDSAQTRRLTFQIFSRPRWPLKVPHLWPVKLLHPDHRKLIC